MHDFASYINDRVANARKENKKFFLFVTLMGREVPIKYTEEDDITAITNFVMINTNLAIPFYSITYINFVEGEE